ncbi:hypothetical protein E2P65_04760 [Candidatus Bathyarchaeota archaeon]|nr:hypothetical protein E2P65_04760 [Candidatus Bathyarchaeota archaeon]
MSKDAENGHGFSVELRRKNHVRSISISNSDREGVLLEGTIGEIEELDILDGAVLQIKGTHGTIMVDLCEDKLRALLEKKVTKRVTSDEGPKKGA